MDTITRNEWNDLPAEQQWQYVVILEELLKSRQEVLDAIPPCPVHGECVPHALEWIEKHKTETPPINNNPV